VTVWYFFSSTWRVYYKIQREVNLRYYLSDAILTPMKVIPVSSLKGGVGKSTITARLGLALHRKGFKVSLCDIDVHGPNLHLALGLKEPPPLGVDTEREVIVPSDVNGIGLVTLASHFATGTRVLWLGQDKFQLVREMLTGTIDWKDPDFLLIDLPPSSGEEIMALLENLKQPYGALVVTQPSDFATEDAERLLDLLREYEVPLIGVVANMDGSICPACGHRFYAFSTRRIDIESFCEERGIQFVMSIPQSADGIDAYADTLAERILSMQPAKMPSGKVARRISRAILRKAFEKLR